MLKETPNHVTTTHAHLRQGGTRPYSLEARPASVFVPSSFFHCFLPLVCGPLHKSTKELAQDRTAPGVKRGNGAHHMSERRAQRAQVSTEA